jgi:hypothetical protein
MSFIQAVGKRSRVTGGARARRVGSGSARKSVALGDVEHRSRWWLFALAAVVCFGVALVVPAVLVLGIGLLLMLVVRRDVRRAASLLGVRTARSSEAGVLVCRPHSRNGNNKDSLILSRWFSARVEAENPGESHAVAVWPSAMTSARCATFPRAYGGVFFGGHCNARSLRAAPRAV